MAGRIRCKRIYEPMDAGDGMRILVERLWPRGIRRADAAVDHWMKEVAPSPALRQWYGHQPARWEAFRQCYRDELAGNTGSVDELLQLASTQDVTLVYAARDEPGNSAQVLRDYLEYVQDTCKKLPQGHCA